MKIVLSIFLAATLSIASWYLGAWQGASIQHKADGELLAEYAKQYLTPPDIENLVEFLKAHARN